MIKNVKNYLVFTKNKCISFNINNISLENSGFLSNTIFTIINAPNNTLQKPITYQKYVN
jgi:hypothetical protein